MYFTFYQADIQVIPLTHLYIACDTNKFDRLVFDIEIEKVY